MDVAKTVTNPKIARQCKGVNISECSPTLNENVLFVRQDFFLARGDKQQTCPTFSEEALCDINDLL
jgi:hypothetical protein